MNTKFGRYCLGLLSILAFMAFGYIIERKLGVPIDMTMHIAIGGACVVAMVMIGLGDYPGENWPLIAAGFALLFNVGVFFFTPLMHVPASKLDLGVFGAPDAVIFLAARTISYPVIDNHKRAVRQQMIVGLIMALPFCAMILALLYVLPHRH